MAQDLMLNLSLGKKDVHMYPWKFLRLPRFFLFPMMSSFDQENESFQGLVRGKVQLSVSPSLLLGKTIHRCNMQQSEIKNKCFVYCQKYFFVLLLQPKYSPLGIDKFLLVPLGMITST